MEKGKQNEGREFGEHIEKCETFLPRFTFGMDFEW